MRIVAMMEPDVRAHTKNVILLRDPSSYRTRFSPRLMWNRKSGFVLACVDILVSSGYTFWFRAGLLAMRLVHEQKCMSHAMNRPISTYLRARTHVSENSNDVEMQVYIHTKASVSNYGLKAGVQ